MIKREQVSSQFSRRALARDFAADGRREYIPRAVAQPKIPAFWIGSGRETRLRASPRHSRTEGPDSGAKVESAFELH